MADTLLIAPADVAVLGQLATLAAAAGYDQQAIGPVLALSGHRADLDAFLIDCSAELAAGDAARVRVLFTEVDVDSASALDVLAPAMLAPTLATVSARAAYGPLLDALETGVGVDVAYQPVVEIRTGRTIAFEALLRLTHDGREVPPLEVFRAATEVGRSTGADAAARRAAVSGAAGWIGGRGLFLNLLPEAVTRPDDLDATDEAVANAGLGREQVCFEVPAACPDGGRHVIRVLEHLRARGYRIGLDDVVDAPDSMALVERLRPDSVKVSSALVRELPRLGARSSVATVVGAAHAVGARVSAKTIETAAQLDAVLFVGVDDAQGWQVGQPMRPPSGRRALIS